MEKNTGNFVNKFTLILYKIIFSKNINAVLFKPVALEVLSSRGEGLKFVLPYQRLGDFVQIMST